MRSLPFILLAALLAGCASLAGGRGNRVDEVHLFGLPVTLNLDGQPGPDGFAVRVYVTQDGRAKGSTISKGFVEVLMFDGVVSTDNLMTTPPTQLWKFTPRELGRFTEKTSLGDGYRFALRWNEAPKRGHLTIVARYLGTKGTPIYSSPSTITAAAK